MPSMGAGHVLHLASRHDVPSRTQVWSQLPPPPFALRSFFRRRPCSRRHAAPRTSRQRTRGRSPRRALSVEYK